MGTALGTLARVLEAEQFDDGRWAVIGVGVDRLEVDPATGTDGP